MPSLFSKLKSTLSHNTPADTDDVLSVKGALNHLGYYDKPEYGITEYTDDPMFHSIRKFQRDHNLSVDGIMNPNGETEENLRRVVQQQAFPVQFPPLKVPVPAYRKEIFKPYARRKEWETWTNLNLNDESLPLVMRGIFNDIFAAEGGMKQAPGGTAVAGILQSTLNNLEGRKLLENVKKIHNGKVPKTSELIPASAQAAYKAYFEDAIGTAVLGYNRHPLHVNQKRGVDMLSELGEPKVVGAVSDTLFRHGSSNGTLAIQEALNQTLNIEGKSDNQFGSQTYRQLQQIVGNSKDTNTFLKLLAERRKTLPKVEVGDYERFKYYQ